MVRFPEYGVRLVGQLPAEPLGSGFVHPSPGASLGSFDHCPLIPRSYLMAKGVIQKRTAFFGGGGSGTSSLGRHGELEGCAFAAPTGFGRSSEDLRPVTQPNLGLLTGAQ